MRERKLKVRKYLAGIMLVFVVAALVGILRFGNLDKLKGKIKIKDFYLSNISTKLNGNVLDATGEGPVVSKGFDEISYELKYRLSNSNQRRDVTIVGTLDSDNGYASFKRLTGDNITSTLSDDNRRIEIVISNLEADTEITTSIPLTVNGAPNGYIIKPNFQIKESTAENFINVYTNPIEVNTNNLRGTVRDTEGNTISDIIISVYKNKKLIKETYTNQNGEYILSDLPEDNYTVKINEEIYKDIAQNDIAVKGDTKLDLTAERVYPFTLEIHKYITKVDAINLNTPILRTYDNASMVVFPVNKLTNLSGKVYYSIVVENTGEKEGIVSVVKDELPDYMSFDEKLNDGFELKDGIIYDRNLEGKVLKPGEKIIDNLVLNIENTKEARTYLNRVNSLGEIYEHVVYILDDKIYKEEDVLEGEKIIKPSNSIEDFEGWYTDSEYTNLYNFNNIVTKDLILYGKTKQEQKIDIYPVRFHNDNDVTTKYVEYNNKVTPIDDPIKEHHIFINWLDEEDLPFDFDTLIVRERDLYSSFEEVLPPKISHTPTMWTNQNVTVTLEKNENLTDDTGYSYLYKTSDTSYSSYNNPFVISENTTIIAKGVKEEIDSVVENHQIVNIDKLNPRITLFSQNAVNRSSVVLNVSALDNESGINYYEVYQDDVKVGEKHLECYNETTFDGYEACRSDLPKERETTYTVTGLNHSTTYRFKVKVFDKAGNSVMSDEIEVTTTTPRIVARLIGYNNSLFTDTVDENTGDVIVPKEDKYINFESLAEAFDYEDLYDCKNVQCTIQMVTGTDESVEVLEGQNLTLDLNGQIVSGINSEYTIKNNGEFTLIESKPENEDAGKIVNNLGVGILNKSNASLTLGEGYSDRPVTGSTVSVTRPYVYGETVGIKNETNGNFTMFDGKIVSPVSQTPGYGAVNGRVTGTEYSYTSISSVDTIDARNYQVVTLSVLVSPEARVNQSVYYSKLSSAMNSVNVGTTTFEDDDTPRKLIEDLKSTGKYGFMYNEDNGTWTSYTEGDTAEANAYLIIDLTNEPNNKSLSIDYSVDTNYETITSFLDTSIYDYGKNLKPANITVNEYISNNNLGDSIPSYRHTETEYGFELEKGKVYIVNIAHAKCYEDQIGAMTINDIKLSDIETNHDKISATSDISVSSYGFYYDSRDRKIKSNNQYNSESSTALGFIEIDLTDKEGEYDLVVDAIIDNYALRKNWNDGIYSEGSIWVGETKSSINSSTIMTLYGTKTYKKDVDVYDPVDYDNGTFGGYTSSGYSRVQTLTGGKKYYLGFKYEKVVPDASLFPSREDFENANCSDQLIINSVDLIKKSDTSTNLSVFNTETINDNIVAELVENSNGGLILDNGKYRTNNVQTNQETNTSATIDLTSSNKGEMLVVDLTHLSGSDSSDITINNSSYEDCTNCISVFQKRIVDGEEVKYYVGYGTYSGYNNQYDYNTGLTKTRYLFPLAGGYEYEVKFNTISPSSSMASFPNIRIDSIRTEKLTNVDGNYFNSITGYYQNIDYWFNQEYSDDLSLMSSNTYRTFNYYKDSFIKIDLSDYSKNQLLSYNLSDEDDYGKYAIYLTNNNRALTKEDLLGNKHNLLVYNYNTYDDKGFVLEKGKVYYLHFANFSDIEEDPYYYDNNYYVLLNKLKLTPIDESVMNVGNQNVFSGTYNIVNEREEKYTYPKRVSEEPTIIENDSFYGFEYNSETGMYDALNTEIGSIAIKTFKIDLSEASEDKLYSFSTNGGGFHNYYTLADNENITNLDVNKYISNIYNETIPTNYYDIDKDTSVLLEKGKVHYIQVVTMKKDNDTPQLSLKITEVNSSNSTGNYNTINEIREFNQKVDTVQLLKDVVADNTINIDYSEEVVLDINGYALSSNSDYIIENSGNLTVSDSKYTNEVSSYRNDLAEYQKYAGLCDGCTPSEEYILDHTLSTDFNYTGDVQVFTATEAGEYKIEAWGAQGGSNPSNSNIKGGYGAYSTGVIELQAGDKLYVYVGGAGSDSNRGQGGDGGYNGGGAGGNSSNPNSTSNFGGGGGGGASHVAKVTGTLSSLESHKGTLSDDELYYISNDIVIVAGGGGGAGPTGSGANDSKPGGSGGGSKGSDGVTVGTELQATGATQTIGNSFGQGAEGRTGTSVKNGNKGAGGGGGGFFGGKAQSSTGADTNSSGAGGSGYIAYSGLSNKKMVMYSEDNTYESTNENTKTEITTNHSSIPVADYAKEGNGYVKISKNLTEEQIEELYNQLPRRYSVKEEPTNNVTKNWISNNNGKGIIKNNENAMLYLNDINLSVSSDYGIYNEGLVQIDAETIINVNEEKSTGIANFSDGDIVNNGEFTISVEPGCSYKNVVAATGISYSGGEHNLSNVTITGENGIGILVDTPAKVNLHSSSINMDAYACFNKYNVTNYYDNYNKTDSSNSALYDKEYLYYYDYSLPSSYSSSVFDRLSGSIVNKGNANVDSGTDLVGKIENYGKLSISDGTSFNEIYQADKYVTGPYTATTREFENPNTNISNTIANIDQIVNRAGTININEESGEVSSITSSNKDAILNFGTVNTNGGNISSIFNMGLLNSNNTDYNKLYNLHTYYWLYNSDKYLEMGYTSSEDLRGIANVNGGTISTDTIVNENEMTLDGVTVQNGVINRGDLTVKGNSNIVGDNKSAILNYPFKLTNDDENYRFSRTSLSIGDKDNEASNGPVISSTSGSYAITGDCNPKGTTPVDSFTLSVDYDPWMHTTSFRYADDNDIYGTYINSNGLLTSGGEQIKDKINYPENADNLCSINYYDGTIQNTTVTDMTDVVDIPINEVRNGYDVLYDNSELTGKVTIAPIDSASRSAVIDVNGTPYKSLETAISNAPNNSIISISGNYDSANKVVIPSNKTLTINYLNGAKVNSYSKDALITNNGSLTLTGAGTNNVVGVTAYENNNNMIINGVNNIDYAGNYDSQSNLIKNNKNLTINDGTSNGLDIITVGEENTLTINDGIFNSNTIFGNDSEITVTGGYFDTNTNSNYYETTYDFNMQQSASHYKPLFNVENSIVNINNFDANNDSRYSAITNEQNLGTFDSSSTLNLNNSNFGGKSSKEDIYTLITGGSTINITDGTYDNLLINLKDSDNTYNQTSGIVNGALLVSGYSYGDSIYQGYRNVVNITGGKINSSKAAAILLLNVSDSEITVGTKGSGVSKLDPEIEGVNYGLVQSGTYSIQSKLYFYDGIFKATGNPIDFHIEEVEPGYDVAFNRNKNPKEKYLDILPVIYNKTTNKYYYDVQESFDEANTNDELIWIKDYTNYSYSPSLVVNSNKKFKLYLSYLKSTNAVVNQGDTEYVDSYRGYDGIVEPTQDESVGASYITINNRDENNPSSDIPFIINNGDLTIISAATTSSGNSGEIVVDSNFESVSGATIVKNNGTLNLNGVTSINIKALGTMYENNGTMNVNKSNFYTLQSNILTNNGTLNITGIADTESDCYEATNMKVYISNALIDLFDKVKNGQIHDAHEFLKESIINNTGATMNIEYLNYDSDYSFISILNNGTMEIDSSTIEQYRDDNVSETEPLDNSIINNGSITANNLYLYSTKGILNNGNLSYSGIIDAGFDTGITNTGTLTFSGVMTGAGKGIYDTGSTSTSNSSITTYREVYYGTGAGSVTLAGSFSTYGSFTRSYEVSRTINESCSNEKSISGTLNNPKVDIDDYGSGKDYPLSTGTIYVEGNNSPSVEDRRTLTINGAYVGLNSSTLSSLVYESGKCYKDGIRYDQCPAPYQHTSRNKAGDETGSDYSIGAIEAHNANVIMNGGSINGVFNNSNTYGIHSYLSNITENGGYISSMYVNNNASQSVTIGTKNNDSSDNGIYLGKTSCSSIVEGINYYGGTLVLDPDNLCHISDTEDNFIIFNPSSNYLLANASVILNVDTGTPYSSIQTAVSEASSGDRLRFLNTTSLPLDNYDVDINKNITIDANGKLIDANFNVISGTTTIEDSTNSSGRITNVTNTSGTLNVTSGIIDLIDNKSTANINGGSMKKIINSGTTNIPNTINKIDEITNSGTLNITGNINKNITKIDTTGSVVANNTNINNTTVNVTENGSLSIEGTSVKEINTYNNGSVITDSDTSINKLINNNSEGTPLTIGAGTIVNLENNGFLIVNGTNVTKTLTNAINLTINSGTINKLDNIRDRNIRSGRYVINNANISNIYDASINGPNYIYDGTYGDVYLTYQGTLCIEGGEFQYIESTNAGLIFGKDDGIVNTNSPKVKNLNANSYAIHFPSNKAISFYDGTFTSTKPIVIDATVGTIPTGYEIYTAPDYDGLGNLTGTYSMSLREITSGETKIACVEGICYSTLQEAIDASVRNYSEIDGCPEVRIGDEFYFTVELDQDLVLDPQYELTINLNSHNINDNGYNIPENITLINGSRNGTNLESSLSRFLANVFNNNSSSKNIIITKMSDGNALDSSKTYKLYSYNNGTYKPVKVDIEEAGKYKTGNKTYELKSIKGRIYINDLSSGEYMLKDNLDNDLEFTIYNDGTISPNIKENITSDYGRISSSAVATLIVTIQTGVFRNKNILIVITVISLAIIGLLLYKKNKSMKETI